ncbi:hypothetical protein PAXINDRAFT_7805 [Paxillus involutus ATCC 200175]|nr:hypothetical protein PAXINDRAFT_7805 [Paxillus involutus ATCC 200175]
MNANEHNQHTSNDEDSPRTPPEPPPLHHPSPPPTPSLPVEQTVPTSRRSTYQRRRDGQVLRTGTRCTHEDDEWSRRGVELRSRGSEEADDEGGDDVDVDHAHVVLQTPHMTRQTAYNEAADPSNPNARGAGTTKPAGRSYEPPNKSNKGEKGGEEDDMGEWASGIETPSSNDNGGDEDVHHAYVVPTSTLPPPYHALPTPDRQRPPLSTPLKGEEKNSQQSTTQQPRWTPYDQRSNGEGQGEGVGGDDEVEGNDDQETSYGDDERRRRKEEARDEARDDEGSREVDRDVEGSRDDEEDALHDQEGKTDAPDSVPPSVRLEGERNRRTSLNVEVDDDHAKDDDHTQQPSRHPVGTTDSDERRPSEPTEPLDEEKGVRRENGKVRGTLTVEEVKSNQVEVESVKTKESRQGDEPRGRGGNGEELKEVKVESGGQSKGNGSQPDGRTNDTGDTASSTSCESERLEMGPLAEDENGQHRDGIQNTSTNVPAPSTPPPYATKQPTHLANPPRLRGRLKTQPTSVSKPECTDTRTKSNSRVDDLPDQPDATEAAQGYWGSVSEPPQSRTKGTEARTSTPHTIDITHTPELPYWVITRA